MSIYKYKDLYAKENQGLAVPKQNTFEMYHTDRSNSPASKFTTPVWIPILLGFFLMACSGSDQGDNIPENGKETVATLDGLFLELADQEENGSISEEVVQVNEAIRRTIENIPHGQLAEIGENYAQGEHGFSLALSEDEKLGIFSWHTKMDASGNKIKNMALYESEDRLEVSSLLGSPIIYEKIHQVETYKGEVLYVLHGNEQSGSDNFYRLDAYTVRNGKLEQVPAFPNNESSISTAKMEEGTDPSDPLGFKVVMNGSRILFPDINGKAIKDQTLAFNGKKYVHESEIE